MAWPFTSVLQPNLDTGPGTPIPLTSTLIDAATCWLLGAHFTNSGAVQRIVTVTDLTGNILCQVTIPGGQEVPYEWAFRPATGIKWSVTGTGCAGHIWGYK